MSNRKKPRNQATNKRHKGKGWFSRGLDGRREFPLHDDSGPAFDAYGKMNLEIPDVEVEVLKEVPAMHTGLPGGEHAGEKVQVGIAKLHSDGTVGLRYDEDAPIWAMEEIQAYADKIGYSLGEGGFTNGTA